MKTILFLILPTITLTLYGQHLEVEGEIDVKGNKVTNVADPTLDQDAATKAYVDRLEKRISDLEFDIKYLHGLDSITDFEGNSYKIVKIGDQFWMAENLRSTKYNDGIGIPPVTDDAVWSNITIPAFCWYNNDQDSLGLIYGALYNYYVVADTNSRNVCPEGWHIPTKSDWIVLAEAVGGQALAGNALKEAGAQHWISTSPDVTNSSGFTALPGGYRQISGDFINVGQTAEYWSSTSSDVNNSWHRALAIFVDSLVEDALDKNHGFSVRCIKD